MTRPQDIPWKKIAVEATAIVASILLAFAIDAWWQDRQTRIEEREVLAGLHAEFVANHDTLSQQYTYHLQGLQALDDILALIEGDQSQDTRSILLAALIEMESPSTTDLGNGTLNALLSSGRVEILTSTRLRALLTTWHGVIGEVRDDETNISKMVFEIFVPFFVQQGYSWHAIERSPGEIPAVSRLLADETFRHLVEVRYYFKEHLTGEFQLAIAAANEIISELEESME